MKFRFCFAIALAVVSLSSVAAIAKIAPLKPVRPVEANGIRYSREGDGRDQYVTATDVATGKRLWRVKVCHTRIKFWMEEDVQLTFITDLKLADGSLFVRDGKARCYSIGITNHRVRKSACSSLFAKEKPR